MNDVQLSTKDEEHMRRLIAGAMDEALGVYIVKLFDVLCSNPLEDNAAVDRFFIGFRKGVTRYWQLQEEILDLDVV